MNQSSTHPREVKDGGCYAPARDPPPTPRMRGRRANGSLHLEDGLVSASGASVIVDPGRTVIPYGWA